MKLNKIMLAMVVMSISGSALAHGYIENPPSRNLLCHADGKNLNKECGAVQYEPQSSGETADGFPEKGPADGKLASGDNWLSKDLNQQTAERWAKTKMKAGVQPFTWTFTQLHPIASFKYYMTKQDWNPNAPLTRDSFDLTPFCVLPSAPAIPQSAGKVRTTHECDVPERTGYQVIYGAWDVADTAGTFYQMIDAQFDDATGEVVVSEWTASVGKIEPATDLNAGDKVAPVHGVNTLYTKAGSPITSIVISIDKAPVEVQSDFSVAGMESEYQMTVGALTLNVDLAATGKMELEAKVYGPDDAVKGYVHTTLEENATQQVAIEMSDLKAGKYTLVVIGIDAEGKSKQQSIGFTLKGEAEIVKHEIKPEVKPEVKPELDGADKQCAAPAWSNAST